MPAFLSLSLCPTVVTLLHCGPDELCAFDDEQNEEEEEVAVSPNQLGTSSSGKVTKCCLPW